MTKLTELKQEIKRYMKAHPNDKTQERAFTNELAEIYVERDNLPFHDASIKADNTIKQLKD